MRLTRTPRLEDQTISVSRSPGMRARSRRSTKVLLRSFTRSVPGSVSGTPRECRATTCHWSLKHGAPLDPGAVSVRYTSTGRCSSFFTTSFSRRAICLWAPLGCWMIVTNSASTTFPGRSSRRRYPPVRERGAAIGALGHRDQGVVEQVCLARHRRVVGAGDEQRVRVKAERLRGRCPAVARQLVAELGQGAARVVRRPEDVAVRQQEARRDEKARRVALAASENQPRHGARRGDALGEVAHAHQIVAAQHALDVEAREAGAGRGGELEPQGQIRRHGRGGRRRVGPRRADVRLQFSELRFGFGDGAGEGLDRHALSPGPGSWRSGEWGGRARPPARRAPRPAGTCWAGRPRQPPRRGKAAR